MSDFFTRVVLHAGRGLGVVRPRLPALFEEGGPGHSFGTPEVVERVEYREAQRSAADRAGHDAARPSDQAAPRVLRPALEPHASDEPVRPHSTVSPPPAPRELSARSRPERTDGGEGTPPGATTARVAARDADRPLPSILQPAAGRPVDGGRVQPAQTSARPPANLPGTPNATQPARAPLPTSPQLRARALRPADGVPRAKADGRQPPGDRDQAADRGVTVEVTIGRVEVRAVVAPRPQPRDSRSRAPEFTLEDYLRQRGRGRA